MRGLTATVFMQFLHQVPAHLPPQMLLDVSLLNRSLIYQPLICASSQRFLLSPCHSPLTPSSTSSPLISIYSPLCYSLGRGGLPGIASLNFSSLSFTLSTLTLQLFFSQSHWRKMSFLSPINARGLWHSAEPWWHMVSKAKPPQGYSGQLSVGKAYLCSDAHPHIL